MHFYRNFSALSGLLTLLIASLSGAAIVPAQETVTPVDMAAIQKKIDGVKLKVSRCVVAVGENGSGVLIQPHGIVLTASHVTIRAGRQVQVRMHDGRTVAGVTLGSNSATDTAAIKLLDSGPWPYLKTVPVGHQPRKGDWCVAFGYPLSFPRGEPAVMRLGRLTGDYHGKLVADCPIMGGDSGGPLVDLRGNLLAINSSVKTAVDQNLFISIEHYRTDWLSMMRGRDVTTGPRVRVATAAPHKKRDPWLGIHGETDDDVVRVRHVHRNSPAEAAGIRVEDVIQTFDGQPISSFTQLLLAMDQHEPGQRIVASVNRYGQPLALTIELGGKPE